jgi:hypothetical protein
MALFPESAPTATLATRLASPIVGASFLLILALAVTNEDPPTPAGHGMPYPTASRLPFPVPSVSSVFSVVGPSRRSLPPLAKSPHNRYNRSMNIADPLDLLLPTVSKPARYTGGEWNAVHKDWDAASVRLVLAYPDLYELGMSNLGLLILYDIANRLDGVLCERAYAPWPDMEAALRAANLPLFTVESRRPLGDFDIIGFTLPHELNYTNVLNMLDLAGIPLLAKDRTDAHPIILGGGAGAYNPSLTCWPSARAKRSWWTCWPATARRRSHLGRPDGAKPSWPRRRASPASTCPRSTRSSTTRTARCAR